MQTMALRIGVSLRPACASPPTWTDRSGNSRVELAAAGAERGCVFAASSVTRTQAFECLDERPVWRARTTASQAP